MTDIKRLAEELLAKFKIDRAPVPVEKIAKGLGATVQYDAFDGNVSAMLFRDEERTIIGVNSTHPRVRQRFSIAHEIGHLKLHKGKMYVDARVNFRDSTSGLAIDQEEIEANAFAAEILMPRTLLIAELNKLLRTFDQSDDTEIRTKLAAVFDVSTVAMDYRLKNLGLIVE